jgi:hypothetical protein
MTIDLRKQLGVSAIDIFFPAVFKILIALIGTVAVWLLLDYVWPHDVDASILAVLARLIVMGVVGTGVYVWFGALLGLKEPSQLVSMVRGRLGGDKS